MKRIITTEEFKKAIGAIVIGFFVMMIIIFMAIAIYESTTDSVPPSGKKIERSNNDYFWFL